MKKMPCLFVRDFSVRPPLLERMTSPGCEWVIDGEGVASRKWDGTACMIRSGVLHRRYDAKRGKTPPAGWEPCEPAADPITGHWPGWLAVGDGPQDAVHREAWATHADPRDGTYELCGPKVGANPERLTEHVLIPHGAQWIPEPPRSFVAIRDYLTANEIEGIVFAHPDGRFAKIRRADYGLPWGCHK